MPRRQRGVRHVHERVNVRPHLAEGQHLPRMVAGDSLEEANPSHAVELVDEVRPVAQSPSPRCGAAPGAWSRGAGRHALLRVAEGRDPDKTQIRTRLRADLSWYLIPGTWPSTVRCVGGTILWDVDTQVDFIEPGGKLYFEGAEEARPAMERLVEAARAAGVVHVASCDQHELSDPEISDEPDFDSTWPPHCLRGTRGAEKIPETKQRRPPPAAARARPAGDPAPPPRRRPRDPDPEEAVRPVHEPEHGDPARHRSIPTRSSSSASRPTSATTRRSARFLRRGRRIAFVEDASRGVDEVAGRRVHRGLARGRRPLHDRRGGGCVTRLRDAPLAADETLRWWGTGSIGCGFRHDLAAARVLRRHRR